MALGTLDTGRFPFTGPSNAVAGYAAITTTDPVEIIAARGVGTYLYITSILCSNTSVTPVIVEIKDGTTTILSAYLASRGGGLSHVLSFPIRLSDNTALNATIDANVIDVRVAVNGFVLS